ncbi:MAG: alpha/beta hydrolase [Clostridia bacterium]|nr:alpha/beta hydrolase [Clostridia bacterium]
MGLHKFMIDKFCGFLTKMDTERIEGQEKYTGLTKWENIPYTEEGDECHLLDVYRPEDAEGKLPVIVDVHGGAWIYGRKEINAQFCHALAKKGFVVVNMSYRTIRVEDAGTFPAILQDVFDAYNWVYDHIEEYGGDLNNVFLIGDSAGAHIAGMSQQINADKATSERLGMSTKLSFRAMGWVCGVSTVDNFKKMHVPVLNYVFKLFFGKGWRKSENYALANVRAGDLNALPPLFMNSAYADFMQKDVIAFDEILTEAGHEHEFVYITEEQQKQDFDTVDHKLDHCYNVHFPEWPECDFVNERMIAFFRAHMAE